MRSAILVVSCWLTLCSAAHAASLGFRCEDDSLHVSFSLLGEFADPTGIVANVRASVVGSCGPGVVINPEPFPYPAFMTHLNTEFTVPTIDADRYLLVSLFGVDASGHEFSVGDSGDGLHFGLGACMPDAIFGRGQIVGTGESGYWLVPCDDHCWWGIQLMLDQVPPGWEAYVYTHQIVNVYGEAFVDGMPGGTYLSVSRVEAELDPAGCEAVAVSDLSWGAVKSMFR